MSALTDHGTIRIAAERSTIGRGMGSDEWVPVCSFVSLDPDRGVAALVHDAQVAVFRIDDLDDGEGVYAVDNRDPATGANVLARGIIGSAGTALYVASPMLKHRFDLRTGRCLDDDTLAVAVWSVRVSHGQVQVLSPAGQDRPR